MGAEACGRIETILRVWDRLRMPFVGRPHVAHCWLCRCLRFTRKGDYDRAIAAANRSIELASAWAYAYFGRAEAYRLKGCSDAALADLDRAIDLYPKNAMAWCIRGALLLRKDEVDRAIADLTKAVELAPDLPKLYGMPKQEARVWEAHALYSRGTAFARGYHFEQALCDLNWAVELDPDNVAVHLLHRAYVYARMGDKRKALADCDEALKHKPGWPEALEKRKEIEKLDEK